MLLKIVKKLMNSSQQAKTKQHNSKPTNYQISNSEGSPQDLIRRALGVARMRWRRRRSRNSPLQATAYFRQVNGDGDLQHRAVGRSENLKV